MTTAGRPTFNPSRGGECRGEKDLSALSKQYSSRDLPGHTKLKYRELGQGTSEELRNRDFRKELQEKELKVCPQKRLLSEHSKIIQIKSTKSKRIKLDKAAVEPKSLDADDPLDNDSSSDEDSDSDDDTAALLAELNKIKKERFQEKAHKEQEQQKEDERIRLKNIYSGNPLLNFDVGNKSGDVGLKIKRRWNDDAIFKNCARTEPEKKSHFINDTIRSEFHKRFMQRYIL